MALFSRNPEASFSPLLRLLDDFDNYSRQGHSGRRTGLPHWQPKFDTIVVGGRTERNYSSGTPPARLIEDTTVRGAITEGGEEQKTTYKETTEDKEASAKPAKQTEVFKKKPAENANYWLTERSIGEFSRSFSFPSYVDQDAVSANFKDGVLNITVLKAKKHESRRVHVD
ncbi:hypothetical protein ACJZ2D_013263 [Fusarium nematophilum]